MRMLTVYMIQLIHYPHVLWIYSNIKSMHLEMQWIGYSIKNNHKATNRPQGYPWRAYKLHNFRSHCVHFLSTYIGNYCITWVGYAFGGKTAGWLWKQTPCVLRAIYYFSLSRKIYLRKKGTSLWTSSCWLFGMLVGAYNCMNKVRLTK